MQPLASLAAGSWTASIGAQLLRPMAQTTAQFIEALVGTPGADPTLSASRTSLDEIRALVVQALSSAGLPRDGAFQATLGGDGGVEVSAANPGQAQAIRRAMLATPALLAALRERLAGKPVGDAITLQWEAGRLTIA